MPNNMSFLPDDYLERRLQRRTNLISLSLFAVVMGAVVAAYFVTNRQRDEVLKLGNQVNADFAEAAKRLEQLETLQLKKNQMVRKAQVTAVLLERIPRSLVLSELVNAMPVALSLTELSFDTRRTRVTQAPTALEEAKRKSLAEKKDKDNIRDEPEPIMTEATMQLAGIAPTDVEVAQFMATLGQNALFRDINLVFSEQFVLDKQEGRKFRIDLALNQDVDLAKFKPKMVKRDLKFNPMDKAAILRPDLPPGPGIPTAPIRKPNVRAAND